MSFLMDVGCDLTPCNEDGSDLDRKLMPMLAPQQYQTLGPSHSTVRHSLSVGQGVGCV